MVFVSKIAKRIPELVFIIWIFLFALLFLNGDYLIYLRPNFVFLIFIGFILSLLIFIGGVFNHRTYESALKTTTHSLIILIPVLYYLISNNASLDSFAFTKKRTDTSEITNNEKFEWRRQTVKNKNLINKVEVSRLNSPFWDFSDTLVETEGQIYKEDQSPYIAIYRFIISCCAADAKPVAVYISHSNLTKNLNNDEWVRVSGKFQELKINGKIIKSIIPDKIQTINPPPKSQWYLYR